jgi:predicted glycogen debranching enzyme
MEASMTFGLIGWLKSRFADLNFEIPIWYPSREQADHREWLITNGLGGFASGTVSGAHTRRYHAMLIAALKPPSDRHLILSRVDEIVTVDGKEYLLATNHWASGVVSPTGYKFVESFTTLPVPTWVFELDGHYLIKQICLKPGTNEFYAGYYWLPDQENMPSEASICVRLLVGFRNFHGQVRGSSDDSYAQFISPNHAVIMLNESQKRLCLAWNTGEYQTEKQWWWDFHFPEESAQSNPDTEDLYFVGSVTAKLEPEKEFSIGAGLDHPIEKPDCHSVAEEVLKNQRQLLRQANLPRQLKTDLLVLACDQFIVSAPEHHADELAVIEGYPWFGISGRAAMVSLPGLTLSTRRFDHAKRIIRHCADHMVNGLLANRLIENAKEYSPPHTEFGGADVTLWWGWAVHHYFKTTKDKEFIKEQLPLLFDAAGHYLRGTSSGIRVDSRDGLLQCANARHEYSWMDTKVADIPITPRAGKAVEICSLWYNFLESILFLAEATDYASESAAELKSIAELCRRSMQKFWNSDALCLYDVIEPARGSRRESDASIRPNQILAIAMPYRAFDARQEKMILKAVEVELFTPMGLRTLAPEDPSYQGIYGCGLAHADQYHRDLSYHQGTAWAWLLGPYCDALVNVYGSTPETKTRISLVVQPLLTHMISDACLGSIAEIFDGDSPHTARGAIAEAASVAELMRWHSWQIHR